MERQQLEQHSPVRPGLRHGQRSGRRRRYRIAPRRKDRPVPLTDGAVISYPAGYRQRQSVPACTGSSGRRILPGSQCPVAGEFLLCELDKTAQTWTQAGNPIAQETVNQPVLAAADHTIYCLYNIRLETVSKS
ncbi:MAG: hypothetical protein ACLT3Y_04870 [Ruminococcus callidus]